MKHQNKRIIHIITHPVDDDFDIAYMILMFMEGYEIVDVAKVELKKNFMPFDSIYTSFYACSSN
jgi:hypothetical protein